MMTKIPRKWFQDWVNNFQESREVWFQDSREDEFKIQEKMDSRLKRKNQEDFTREVLKRFFKKQT